jgi:hypothetical protein
LNKIPATSEIVSLVDPDAAGEAYHREIEKKGIHDGIGAFRRFYRIHTSLWAALHKIETYTISKPPDVADTIVNGWAPARLALDALLDDPNQAIDLDALLNATLNAYPEFIIDQPTGTLQYTDKPGAKEPRYSVVCQPVPSIESLATDVQTGETLDVDMNAGGGHTREAVENVVWTSTPPDGAYRVVVNNFAQRETSNPGFVIEVESDGRPSHYSYNKIVRTGQDVVVVTLHVKSGRVERVEVGDPGITASNISQEKWGLKTEQYVKVTAVMLSPNYWGDNAVGNKHTFFVLEGAKNDEATRGFYNEFLHPRLESHRKVFEVIADKTKCQPTEGQLSGLGFSSTKKDTFIVRAHQGKRQRIFNVNVG